MEEFANRYKLQKALTSIAEDSHHEAINNLKEVFEKTGRIKQPKNEDDFLNTIAEIAEQELAPYYKEIDNNKKLSAKQKTIQKSKMKEKAIDSTVQELYRMGRIQNKK